MRLWLLLGLAVLAGQASNHTTPSILPTRGVLIVNGRLVGSEVAIEAVNGMVAVGGEPVSRASNEANIPVDPETRAEHHAIQQALAAHRGDSVGKPDPLEVALDSLRSNPVVSDAQADQDTQSIQVRFRRGTDERIYLKQCDESPEPSKPAESRIRLIKESLAQGCLVDLSEAGILYVSAPQDGERAFSQLERSVRASRSWAEAMQAARAVVKDRTLAAEFVGVWTQWPAEAGDPAEPPDEEVILAGVAARTVGTGEANHTAYAFNPDSFQSGTNIDDVFKPLINIAADGSSGQRYDYLSYVQSKSPDDENNGDQWDKRKPKLCNFPKFYEIVVESPKSLGVFHFTGHGNINVIMPEQYGNKAEDKKLRDDAYAAYKAKYKFLATEVIATDAGGYYGIAVTDEFFKNKAKLAQSLVFFESCKAGSKAKGGTTTLLDACVSGGARVALGADGCTNEHALNTQAFFEMLDGKAPRGELDNMPFRKAGPAAAKVKATVDTGFVIAGEKQTTLAPAVLSDSAPSKIGAETVLYVTLDSHCDATIIPAVAVEGVVLKKVEWLRIDDKKSSELKITVLPPKEKVAVNTYKVVVPQKDIKSAFNDSHMDGNTDPAGKNGKGPAHDDYKIEFKDGKRVR